MKLYLDTEFNGFQGELLSIGMVSDNNHEFYGELRCWGPINDWVLKNVVPHLEGPRYTRRELQNELFHFLKQFDEIIIIADWPEDIKHFCDLLTDEGSCMTTPPLKFQLIRHREPLNSKIPHHALYDAYALRNACNGNNNSCS